MVTSLIGRSIAQLRNDPPFRAKENDYNPTVICDANILYSFTLRDLLMRLALAELFEARWTREIEKEWTENLLKNKSSLEYHRIERVKNMMTDALPRALVTGYERHISELQLKDPNDRHVLAAAIQAKATIIVTYNIKDFTKSIVEPLGIEVLHPDTFFKILISHDDETFFRCVEAALAQMRCPSVTVWQYVKQLETHQLSETAQLVSQASRKTGVRINARKMDIFLRKILFA